MSKAEKPTISGQRLKGRKRDEKVKFDPTNFRDEIVTNLNAAATLEDAAAYLEKAGNSLDFRRYSDQLFDILIAGGMLAPGGTIVDDGADQAKFNVFDSDGSDEDIKAHASVFNRILRRYKYMQVLLEDELLKVLKFIKAFTPEQNDKLARLTARLMANGVVAAKPLTSLYMEALVKDGLAESFMFDVMRAWLKQSSINSLATAFRKSNVELMPLFPANKQDYSYLIQRLDAAGELGDIITWQESLRTSGVKKELQAFLVQAMDVDAEVSTSNEDLIIKVATVMEANNMKSSDMITLVWTAIMEAVDWNKKADLVGDQALKQIHQYAKFIAGFTATEKSQVTLMNRIQAYCYDNQNLLKSFSKMIMLLYQRDALSEDAVMDWFNKSHSSKGKSVFLAQMDEMVKWLQTAEEEA